MSRPLQAVTDPLRILLTLLSLALLAGCASAPPKPTIITATIQAGADLNPDNSGRASPVVVRLLEMSSLSVFQASDFFSLWDRENETLSSDLLAKEEFLMRPGEVKRFDRTLQDDTRHIAVVAAFRDLERAEWRATVSIVPHETRPVTIRLDSRSVRIVAN